MYYGFMAYGMGKTPSCDALDFNAFGVVNGQNKAKFGSHFEFQNDHRKDGHKKKMRQLSFCSLEYKVR